MSLINKMLQDLEARHETASGTDTPIYQDLRPIRGNSRRGAGRWLAAVVAVLTVGAAAFYGADRLGFSLNQAPFAETAKAVEPLAARESATQSPPEPTPMKALALAAAAPKEEPAVAPSSAVSEPEPKVIVATAPARAVIEPAPPRVVTLPLAPNSQNKADVRIVEPKKANPAPAHTGERKPAEAKAPPRTEPPAVANATETAAVVDKKVRPLTADEKAEAGYRQALRFLDQGRPEDAMRRLRDALIEQPRHVKARELAAGIALQNGHWREAQGLLEEGLRQVPNNYLFARLLARVYLDHGAEAKALAVMESAAPQGSDDGEFSALLALLYQRAGRHIEAVKAYERALAINPGDGRTWLGFAISLEATEQWGAAKSAYARAKQSGVGGTLARYADQRLAELRDR